MFNKRKKRTLRVIKLIEDINYLFPEKTMYITDAPQLDITNAISDLADAIEQNRLSETYQTFVKNILNKKGFIFNEIDSNEIYYWR